MYIALGVDTSSVYVLCFLSTPSFDSNMLKRRSNVWMLVVLCSYSFPPGMVDKSGRLMPECGRPMGNLLFPSLPEELPGFFLIT